MIIYLSTAASDEWQKRCNDKYATQPIVYVQQRWDYTLCKSFRACWGEDFAAVSYPPIQTFPSGKCLFEKAYLEETDTMDTHYCGFINIPFMKQATSVRSVVKIIRKLMKNRQDQELTIITHCFYPQSFYAVKALQKWYQVKVYTIIPDLPDFSYSNLNKKNKLLGLLWKRFNAMKQKLKGIPDGYICFSERQRNYLDRSKPYIVMEGFADIDYIDSIEEAKLASDKRIIMYAGALKQAYGVDDMVRAFMEIGATDAELWIYGDGESREWIEKVSDSRVRYMGCVTRDEVVAVEKSVYALINPRPAKEEYAKCSFPSKLLEYMATGTPVLTTRLESMPVEYTEKLMFIEDDSAEGIKKAMGELLGMPYDSVHQYGVDARRFICTYKTPLKQARTIQEFIERNG